MSQMKDFTILKKLGDGAFSTVHQVKRVSDGAIYAMKKVAMGKLSEKEKQNAVNEIRILASITHTNVIGYKEAFFDNKDNSLCIIMEMADGGDLLQAIELKKKNKEKFTEKQIWHYFVQIVRGLKALHDLKIIHRDIKCANIFLTKDGVVKLGDLNVSKVCKLGLLKTQTGTPYYASPEVWKDQPYDYRSDIWSLGCVLYEMIALLPPFRATSMQGLCQKVIKGVYDRVPSQFSFDLQQIVKSCLQVTPKNRPTCQKILETPGLLNHLTGTLEELDMHEEDEKVDNLLQTIRCPRNLGQITDRLPAPQYKPTLKRSCSQAIGKRNQIQEMEKELELKTRNLKLVKNIKTDDSPKVTVNYQKEPIKRVGGVRKLCSLPTIEEDHVDEDTQTLDHDRYNVVKQVADIRKNQNHRNENIRLSMDAKPLPSARVPEVMRVQSDLQQRPAKSAERKWRPPIIPKSQDVTSNKSKAQLLNVIRPIRKVYAPISQRSEIDDVSTRVSSNSEQRQELPTSQLQGIHNSNSPSYLKAPHIVVSHDYRSHQLPRLRPNARVLSSVNTPKPNHDIYDNANRAAGAGNLYTPNSRYGSNRNMDSSGVSRALGSYRYAGVESAIRLARAESSENILQLKKPVQIERGPRPEFLNNRERSIPEIINESKLRAQQIQNEAASKGLQAIYCGNRRLNINCNNVPLYRPENERYYYNY